MGVGSLNTKAMLSMCFYLCPVFSLSFSLFVFFFCYNVIHLRLMTVVVLLQSPPGKSHLIRFSPRYNNPFTNILKIPIAFVHRRSSFCPSYILIPEPLLVCCLGSHRIPCPSHSLPSPLSAALPHVLIALVAPVAPMAPMGVANNNRDDASNIRPIVEFPSTTPISWPWDPTTTPRPHHGPHSLFAT